MTPKLADDQRQALVEHGGSPVYVVDLATNARYVLLRAEQYESLTAQETVDEADDPRKLYPLIAKTAGAAGWDNPAMDEYNDYDAYKRP